MQWTIGVAGIIHCDASRGRHTGATLKTVLTSRKKGQTSVVAQLARQHWGPPRKVTLGQAQPNGLGGYHICRSVAGDHFASLNAPGCFR